MAQLSYPAIVIAIVFTHSVDAQNEPCAAACAGTASGWAFYASTSGMGLAICSGSQRGSKPVAISCVDAPAAALAYSNSTGASWLSAGYSAIRPDGASAYGSLTFSDGSSLRISDTLGRAPADAQQAFAVGNASSSLSLLSFSRTVEVTAGSCGGLFMGFSTVLSLPLLFPAVQPLELWRTFMPGVYYGDGGLDEGWTPHYAIGGNRALSSFLAREDRLGAPMVLMQDPSTRLSVFIARPAYAGGASGSGPTTILSDTLQGGPVADGRMAFTSLGPQRTMGGNGSALAMTYPGCEFDRTYQSGTPDDSLWRLHPLESGFTSNVSLLIGSATLPLTNTSGMGDDADAAFRDALSWSWHAATAYYAPSVRADLNMSDAQEALVGSLADTYVASSPIPGMPTGFDKYTGVAYSTVLEEGFVGPQLRMAVSLLYSAIQTGNATRAAIGTAMVDAWVNVTSSGYGHSVWDMGSGPGQGHWIDDGATADGKLVVYLRRQVVAHRHALEAAQLAAEAGRSVLAVNGGWGTPLSLKSATWLAWGLSLADVLVDLQAANGSWARQYTALSGPSRMPMATQPSTTATALPLRYLVTCASLTGKASYLTSAIMGGEYAWEEHGARSLYVGAAIDNPDVVDKESALFAMDGFLALHEATIANSSSGTNMASVWLDRAIAAATVASTWVQITDIPNPSDAPSQDWNDSDTSAGIGLIAVGHSGSDTFSSMFLWPLFQLCEYSGDPLHSLYGRLALANSKQGLDLAGLKGYANRGFMSELWSFSVGWDVFSGHNDGRGVGDAHFVPWTSANGAYGITQLCWKANGTAGLSAQCSVQLPSLVC